MRALSDGSLNKVDFAGPGKPEAGILAQSEKGKSHSSEHGFLD
jgi:hypothetical protein